ncbi:MAG: succinate dehydrogenase assembly factor 2 [Thauera sp.]|jgi:antitoxin CptB|nr:succinate dehydrogenase assembly factor 2 [Thauera sp.]
MTINKGRVRWQCRRALLELDLVFTRFLDQHFDHLDDDQLSALEDLLRCEDHELWGMVNGSKACENERWQPVLALLREA